MKRGIRYSDDEVIYLIKANRGFGLDRMVAEIYDMLIQRVPQSNRFLDTLELISDYKEYSGEDLYSIIQDPSMIKMVTREEWREATNNAVVPSGSGLSTNRGDKGKKYDKIGSNAKDIPLPPMKFNWGDVVPLWDREEKRDL